MNDPIRLLIVEDHEPDALLIQQELRRGGIDAESRRVATEEEFLAAFEEQSWTLVLSDYDLPGFNGLTALSLARAHDPDLSLIMISGTHGEEFAVEAMRAGAGDFITKNKLSRLVPAVRRELAARELRIARRQADDAVQIRNRRLQLLSRLAELLLNAGAPIDAATAAFNTIKDELDLHAYFNFLLEADGSLRLDSCAGTPSHAIRLITRLERGEAVCGRVAETGEAWHVSDIQTTGDDRVRFLRHLGMRAYFCSPLKSGEHLLGTLSFATRSRDRFADEEIDFMRTVVRYVALADERVRAERDLRSSELRFRQLADSMPQLVWSAEPDGTVHYYNRRREEFSGFRQRQDGSWVWEPVLHPDDLQATVAAWERSLRTGASYQIEHRVRRADGTFHWYLSRAMPVRDADGKIGHWYGTTTDIDELKRSETERDLLLVELDATIESMPSAVMIYDAEGKIRRMNPAAEKMFRYSPQLKERPFMERKASLRPETPDGHPYRLDGHPTLRALRGETTRAEIMAYHPVGRNDPLWVAVSAAPIKGSDGRILGAVSTTIDVTSLHRLQREREIYVHTISHDLRTPLTVILGHAEMLGTTCQDEDSGQHVDAIFKGGERMEKMIDDLVESARLAGGEITLEKEAVRLDAFLPDLLRQASPALEVGRIIVEVPAETPPVSADPPRLERIITNLLTNALKYSPPESPVTVTARAEGEEVVVAVQDRGQGIHPDDQPHIFDRFYRPQHGRRAGGVGLGLYITRSLVEVHGGRIWVESEPGVGSTFYFTLPTMPGESRSAPEHEQ